MKLKLLFLLILTAFILGTHAQINKYGVPIIKNYTSEEYGASPENWCVVKDHRGVLYAGSTSGEVLEYDGVSWRKINLLCGAPVRSLSVDKNGVVYVGSFNEYGFLFTDNKNRELSFRSLRNELDSVYQNVGNIWKTYCDDGNVYFCEPARIYVYSLKSRKLKNVIELPQYSLFTFKNGNDFYVGNFLNGLMIYKAGELVQAKGGAFYERINIYSIQNHFNDKDKMLITTDKNGIFIYDKETGESILFADVKNNDLRLTDNIMYSANVVDENRFVFGTLYDDKGVFLLDSNAVVVNRLNKNFGLNTSISAGFYSDENSNELWMSLNNGIANVNLKSPVSIIDERMGLLGGAYSLKNFNNRLYVANNTSIFYSTNDAGVLEYKKISDFNYLIWSLNYYINNDTSMFISTDKGAYLMEKDHQIYAMEEYIVNWDDYFEESKKLYTYSINQSKYFSKTYISYDEGLMILSGDKFNWKIEKLLKEPLFHVNHICEYDSNKIILKTKNNGIFWLINDSLSLINEVSSLDIHDLFQSDEIIYFFGMQKHAAYNIKTKTFSFDLGKLQFLNDNKSYVNTAFNDSNSIWISYNSKDADRNARVVRINKESKEKTYFNELPDELVTVIYKYDNRIWCGNSKGLYSIDPNFEREHVNYNCLIRKVILSSSDSLIFHGTFYSMKDSVLSIETNQTPQFVPTLEFKDRDIQFSFAAPFFEFENKTVYSYKLEGYQDEWSKWDTESYKDFTNLMEGDYTFFVKAKNIHGHESIPAKYKFSVLPPWYRTTLAYLLYTIALIFVIILIIKIYTRRLKNEKIRLEKIVKERTVEIVKQKDELAKQNVQLETQKLEIEEQRDIARVQRDHIAVINKEITDSIHYAERIQNAILPDDELLSNYFKDSFILFKPKDIVSGDFYWATKVNEYIAFAAADCTGHGVPGAFMSMLGLAFLNEIVKKDYVTETGQVLNELREYIIKSLQQKGLTGEQKDGMDIALCVLNTETNELQFSGANNPLYLVREKSKGALFSSKGELITDEPALSNEEYNLFEIKGDKMPVAIYLQMDNFKTNRIKILPEDAVFMFSDGFADQFGGPKGKKFKYKPFKKLLLSYIDEPADNLKKKLNDEIEGWKAHKNNFTEKPHEQVDDIVVMGVKF